MLSTESVLRKILNLCENCPRLREGTRHDLIFKQFSNAPIADKDEGMWVAVNATLDAAFAKDCIGENILKGNFGLPMVVNWVRKAEEHPTWDLNSEMLINIKLENIVAALKESNPRTPNNSTDSSPPVKQARTAFHVSNIIVISSDDETNFEAAETRTSKDQKHHIKHMNVIELCPLSRPGDECKRCKVEMRTGGKDFSCHCGAKTIWLSHGRVRIAQAHWATETCKDKTENLKNNTQLTTFFKRSTSIPNSITVACPGLNDETWERRKATHSIAEFISKTFTIYRGNHRHDICRELFGKHARENQLTKAQKSQLIATLDARSTWQVKRHGERSAIYSSDCKRTLICKKNNENLVCSACQDLKANRSLLKALNSDYAKDDDINSSNGDFTEFMTVLAASTRNGLFSNRDATRGLIKAVAIKAERENAGKSTRGMRIDSCLDEFVMTLGAISPRALTLFNDNFAGRGNRSLQMIRAKEGFHLLDGLHIDNFTRIAEVLKGLGYSGPIAAASDQTVCVKRLRHHNGFLVGAQGGDIAFTNASELPELVKSVVKNKELCSKIRAYTIQVPLPNVPTFIVALIASCDKETSNDILEGYTKFMELSRQSGLNILSIGADGAPIELSAQASLVKSADRYFTYTNSNYDVHIQIPLFGHPPRPVVMVQDPKHARKTGANQLASGARLLTIGNYYISIQQLAAILQSGCSPLLHRDVFDCDKQDDGQAFRTLSSSTLAVSLANKETLGLSIYLYVVGEMCDAWLNWSIGHRERLRAAWTTEFFFRHWKKYLLNRQSEPHKLMSFSQNCISPQSFKIFSTLATSLLQLVIAHREFYPTCPLLPWKHGSEPCEHSFGWMRVISPRFTVLDARLMMPKIHLIVKNIMSGHMKIPPSEHMHSGYQYAFGDEPDSDNLKLLTKFPSDIEISEDLKTAYERANHLVTISGMGPLNNLICDTPGVEVEESYENLPENMSDVSVCATQHYDIDYIYQVGSCPEKEVLEAAALLTKEQNTIELFLDTLPEDSESECLKNAAMSISNLLNPACKRVMFILQEIP
ncbi:uncharacterized protein MELLADRAFT_92001 [Melampsora larici-populina 98AG31]|uniref:Uncharacterized protein n=1 Tax=Melampsora larici-populina (strain 98AG31 / pathotype 3-4-7) TaxID=747676 RepID=F4S163_MELLP|nr:uncharacterized protein MELLADRAFT_92001 [Melampsora larici-populina 98AG31]EGG01621.1 hypothetical protein MELLADRAFT_92001 [Melampsora larici-populina 98AG31]